MNSKQRCAKAAYHQNFAGDARLRKYIIIILMVVFAASALGYPACQSETLIRDIPCEVYSSWLPADCTAHTIQIFNESRDIIQTLNWSDSQPLCTFIFNHSGLQSYTINSSLDTANIAVVVDSMVPIAIIIALPCILVLLLILGSFLLSDEHKVIKTMIFLLIPIGLFSSFHFSAITIINYYPLPEFENLIGTTNYWIAILFFILLCYFLIYLTHKIFMEAKKAHMNKLNYG